MADRPLASREASRVADEEANVFACFLLMPPGMFEADAKGLDMTDDDAVKALAKRYQVPVWLIWYRVSLGNRPASRARRAREQSDG